jgi:CRISPR-associated exonuclease Cas4
MLTLTVTDLRQALYCPRIVYFTYCLPVPRPVTYKMTEGQFQHEETTDKERRRSLRAYGLSEGERHFHVHLRSERLGLSGLLDMAIVSPQEVIPVEYKNTRKALGLHHKVQLAAYGLLVEEEWDRPVRRAFVYRIPEREAEEVSITPNMRRSVGRTMARMREMVASEAMPPPTRRRERCADCEFRNFCGDV